VQQVEEALKEFPEIVLTSVTVGANNRNEAEILVKLSDLRATGRRSQKLMEAAVRSRLERIAGVELSVGFDRPIFINLIGPSSDALPGAAGHHHGQDPNRQRAWSIWSTACRLPVRRWWSRSIRQRLQTWGSQSSA